MSHVVLVAFEVKADSFEDAQEYLMANVLPSGSKRNAVRSMAELREIDPDRNVESWWIAEDERYDHSDMGSAVFIPGDGCSPTRLRQAEAHKILAEIRPY